MTHRLVYYDGTTPQAHVANLVVDTDTGFIGVGIEAPTNPLTINSTSNRFICLNDNNATSKLFCYKFET